MKEKKVLIATKQMELEIEKFYPYFTKLKNQIQFAIASSEKSNYLNVLRKAEAHISSEVTKLRNKPNRATKYVSCLRRLISCLRLMLNYLKEREEIEAYPTLALISSHFLDILLASSMTSRNLPKSTASTSYSFLKMIFDRDAEYVLDIIICSNVADDAVEANSIGFYILSEVLRDQHLFLNNASTFAKFCTIARLLNDCKNGNAIVKEAIKDLTIYPSDLKTHIEVKYGFPTNIRFNVSTVIENIQPRKVVSATRMERLVVVSCKKTKLGKQSDNLDSLSDKATCKIPETDSFFFDVEGSYTDKNENIGISTTFQTIDFDGDDENREEPNVEENIEEEDDIIQLGDKLVESDSESCNNQRSGSEMDDGIESGNEDLESLTEDIDCTSGRLFEDMYERREFRLNVSSKLDGQICPISYSPADGDEESIESHDQDSEDRETYELDVSLSQPELDSDEDGANSDSTIANVATINIVNMVDCKVKIAPLQDNDFEDSDDEIRVVYEEPLAADNEEEERDLADSESGEDYVPNYDDEDYIISRGSMSEESISPKKPKFQYNVEGYPTNACSTSQLNEPSPQVPASPKAETEQRIQLDSKRMQTRNSMGTQETAPTEAPKSPKKQLRTLKENEEGPRTDNVLDVSFGSDTSKTSSKIKVIPIEDQETETKQGKILLKLRPNIKEKTEKRQLPKRTKRSSPERASQPKEVTVRNLIKRSRMSSKEDSSQEQQLSQESQESKIETRKSARLAGKVVK